MQAPNPFPPVPKRIYGEFAWAHPRLLTAESSSAEPWILDWIARTLRPGGVFFDVGAHYGWVSLKAARILGRTGSLVAFEPSPCLVELLDYHRRVNRISQMVIVPKAVSDSDAAEVPFFLVNDGLSSRNSLVIGQENVPFLSPGEKKRVLVPAVTLDSYSRQTGLIPTVIKIDVEGAEGKVLEGARNVLRLYRPDLVLSVHPYWLPAPQNVAQILDLLAELRYSVVESHVTRAEGVELSDYLCSVIQQR